ncbi:MAG: hypothetical protein COB24_12965 [Hyphomicrobiales bacterium]|nr:MAG: hypothetical protein COB24_12965 [Hyphomicrobiales bacterium]
MLMSDYLGEEVTKNVLDAYAAETRHTHMIPLTRLETLIAAKFKQIVVPTVYNHLIKSHQINDKIVEMQAAEKEHGRKFKIIAAQQGIAI